jgi:hypothetical protein
MRALAEFYDVSAATVKDWERRGAPVQDPAAMVGFVMNEPEIRAGYERAQAVADRLPSMARRAAAAGDVAVRNGCAGSFGWLAVLATLSRVDGCEIDGCVVQRPLNAGRG